NDALGIPVTAACAYTFTQLRFDITVCERVGQTATWRGYGLGDDFPRCEADADAGGAVRHGAVEFGPHLLAEFCDIRPEYSFTGKLGNAGGAHQQTEGNAMMDADAGVALVADRTVSAREQ